MEKYSMFLGRKNQYCENDYITKCKSRDSQGRERNHQRAEGEESMFNREFHLDSDEKSICYSATINYVRTDGQATKGFQK